MPDPDLGERVCLYVVPAPGALVSLEDVRASLQARGVAKYKWPERLQLVGELSWWGGEAERSAGEVGGHGRDLPQLLSDQQLIANQNPVLAEQLMTVALGVGAPSSTPARCSAR